MGKKNHLNEKRLTRKQVQELIRTEGKLHEEFTRVFEETYPSGYVKRDLVYELDSDRFLLVFDEKGVILPGKGDIYPKDYFLRYIRWIHRVRENYQHNRVSSLDHWLFYSKNKLQLVDKVDDLVKELCLKLDIPNHLLDCSYESLDLVSSESEKVGLEEIEKELYDNLVAYVGEVIRKKIKGMWVINQVPSVCKKDGKVIYHPINIVFNQLLGLDPIDLRKETINEIRQQTRFINW